MTIRNLASVMLALSFFSSAICAAAPAGKVSQSAALNPEALGAKAFLEDVLVRRYAQELGTRVDRQGFTLGAQLDLAETPKEVKITAGAEPEPISDLMLGTIDPEELIKKYADNAAPPIQDFLTNYRIRTVTLSVGLKEELGPEVKADVEKWLKTRLSSEFGSAGKGDVVFIKMPTQLPNESFLDRLNRFQGLAGQLVLALALLLGTLLWKFLATPISVSRTGAGDSQNISLTTANGAGPAKEEQRQREELEEKERVSLSADVERLTQRLVELVPRLQKDLESVVRSWCQNGESGRLKLACFAEAVGRELGRLPIPVDALPDVSKVFARMTELSLREKRDTLQKSYWDLLTAMNLGPDTLNQPFGYLGGVNVGVVSQVLMDQNPKMKTLVSLFLPTELRARYVKSLSRDDKRDLLTSAASLSEIGTEELKSLDGNLMSKLKPNTGGETVPLEMTLNKLVGTLSPSEEATLLNEISGSAIQEFKRATPSIAFLDGWPDDKLSILLSRVSADEVVAFLRIRPELKDRMLGLCPPLTAEMAADELNREDKLTEKDRDQWLEGLRRHVTAMADAQEVALEEIFKTTASVTPFTEAKEAADETDLAA